MWKFFRNALPWSVCTAKVVSLVTTDLFVFVFFLFVCFFLEQHQSTDFKCWKWAYYCTRRLDCPVKLQDIFNYKGYVSRPRARKVLEIIEDYKLVNVWREVCPETQGYTLRTCNTVKQGRLGYFLIPDTLLSEISGI